MFFIFYDTLGTCNPKQIFITVIYIYAFDRLYIFVY